MPAKTRSDRILALLAKRGTLSTSDVAKSLRVSRQAAHRRLAALAERGEVVRQGAGRAARWVAPDAASLRFAFATAGLAEDRVWDLLVARVPALAKLPRDARSIAHYAATEVLNNAIEHAHSDEVTVVVSHDARGVVFEIEDAGIGAFESVRAHFRLATALDALGELSKGKVTTLAERHTGEGLFFTSKAVERFELEANGVAWVVDNARGDFTAKLRPTAAGTRVRLVVPFEGMRPLEDVFAEHTDDFAFTRTRTVVKLFAIGVEFVSRSEARRLLHGLERFREVVLDFEGVEAVGQGFADEVFRVWARAHPETRLVSERAAPAVEFMLRRAGAAGPSAS